MQHNFYFPLQSPALLKKLLCSSERKIYPQQSKMKMVLLLLILPSCLCAPTFVVNVTQSSYQAEEKHSITLEWTFSTKPHSCLNINFIMVVLVTDHRLSVLYHEHDGVEVSESQDGQFAGRVQSDKDVLREGRIRLHVSRLRTEDSGLYVCEMKTDCGYGSESCRLNVSAEDFSQPQGPTVDPQPDSGGRIGFYIFLGLTAAAAAVLVVVVPIKFPFSKSVQSKSDKKSPSTSNTPENMRKQQKNRLSDKDLVDMNRAENDQMLLNHDSIQPFKAVSLYGQQPQNMGVRYNKDTTTIKESVIFQKQNTNNKKTN
ncbi:uncharacterized protein LOC108251288 isoform X2 [Kryptolebias marmoratus]|uniref:uncharacterized protein LOC108251288 isoform X2 n=1 Tax=Kryptolebias marmoratus TaxID=37003 RepID=UPI0018ACD6A3|nr:uncharacterized protein LOC108251288 isoform X2 [Kryptolebias marmoratus]